MKESEAEMQASLCSFPSRQKPAAPLCSMNLKPCVHSLETLFFIFYTIYQDLIDTGKLRTVWDEAVLLLYSLG